MINQGILQAILAKQQGGQQPVQGKMQAPPLQQPVQEGMDLIAAWNYFLKSTPSSKLEDSLVQNTDEMSSDTRQSTGKKQPY